MDVGARFVRDGKKAKVTKSYKEGGIVESHDRKNFEGSWHLEKVRKEKEPHNTK